MLFRSLLPKVGSAVAAVAACGGAVHVSSHRWSHVMASGTDTIYDFTCNDIDGNPVSLEKYRGKTVLIVNVASK